MPSKIQPEQRGKTKNMTTLSIRNSIDQLPLRRCLLLTGIVLSIGWLGAAPGAWTTCQQGCDTNLANTFLGNDALTNNTTGFYNTATSAGLTVAKRVAYQRAIEEVYWRHRIWPKERPDPKPSLGQVVPSAQLEKKVEDYLRNSQVLEDYWQRPLSAEQLQAEMQRIAQHTRQPEVLRELFDALGNDPFVIAECLARPA